MPTFIYIASVVLLWLVAGSGAVWWTLSAFEAYDTEWALLLCLLFLVPEAIILFVVHRIWRLIWAEPQGREPAGPGPFPDVGRHGPRSVTRDGCHPQWLCQMKTERERRI